MYESYFYCIMLSGPKLPSGVSGELVREAAILFRDKKKKRNIRGEDFEGTLRSNFDTVVIGSLAGIFFKASIECEIGSLRVHFIVAENDLNEIIADRFDPVDSAVFSSPLSHQKWREVAEALEFPPPGTNN